MINKRDLDQPITATDDLDPSNTDAENLTAPLDPDDNVFTLVNPEQPQTLENHPANED